jgi:uncharacterized Fe-S center protein
MTKRESARHIPRAGDLVRVICHEAAEGLGLVESVVRIDRAARDHYKATQGGRDYLARWGSVSYYWVLVGGERWSLGPDAVEMVK